MSSLSRIGGNSVNYLMQAPVGNTYALTLTECFGLRADMLVGKDAATLKKLIQNVFFPAIWHVYREANNRENRSPEITRSLSPDQGMSALRQVCHIDGRMQGTVVSDSEYPVVAQFLGLLPQSIESMSERELLQLIQGYILPYIKKINDYLQDLVAPGRPWGQSQGSASAAAAAPAQARPSTEHATQIASLSLEVRTLTLLVEEVKRENAALNARLQLLSEKNTELNGRLQKVSQKYAESSRCLAEVTLSRDRLEKALGKANMDRISRLGQQLQALALRSSVPSTSDTVSG